MAKIVRVGYGSEGQGVGSTDGYLYVVNNNVKTSDIVFPSVIHYKSGRVFGTTGKVLGTETKQVMLKILDKNGKLMDIAGLQTARDLGVGTARGAGGKFMSDRSTHNENGEYILSERDKAIRGGNILSRAQGDMAKTEKAEQAETAYENYTKTFYKQGEQQ